LDAAVGGFLGTGNPEASYGAYPSRSPNFESNVATGRRDFGRQVHLPEEEDGGDGEFRLIERPSS
jgi:hypothetical protein